MALFYSNSYIKYNIISSSNNIILNEIKIFSNNILKFRFDYFSNNKISYYINYSCITSNYISYILYSNNYFSNNKFKYIIYAYNKNNIKYILSYDFSSFPSYSSNNVLKYRLNYSSNPYNKCSWWDKIESNRDYYGYLFFTFKKINNIYIGIEWKNPYVIYVVILDEDLNKLYTTSYIQVDFHMDNYLNVSGQLLYDSGNYYYIVMYAPYSPSSYITYRCYLVDLDTNTLSLQWTKSYNVGYRQSYVYNSVKVTSNSAIFIFRSHDDLINQDKLMFQEVDINGNISNHINLDKLTIYYHPEFYNNYFYILQMNAFFSSQTNIGTLYKYKRNGFGDYTLEEEHDLYDHTLFNYPLNIRFVYKFRFNQRDNGRFIINNKLYTLFSFKADEDNSNNDKMYLQFVRIDLSDGKVETLYETLDMDDDFIPHSSYMHGELYVYNKYNYNIFTFFPHNGSKHLYEIKYDLNNDNIYKVNIYSCKDNAGCFGAPNGYNSYYNHNCSLLPFYNNDKDYGFYISKRYWPQSYDRYAHDRKLYIKNDFSVIFDLHNSSLLSFSYLIAHCSNNNIVYILGKTFRNSYNRFIYLLSYYSDNNITYKIFPFTFSTNRISYKLSNKLQSNNSIRYTIIGNPYTSFNTILFTLITSKYPYTNIISPSLHYNGISSKYILNPGLINLNYLNRDKVLFANYNISVNSISTGINISYTDVFDLSAIANANKYFILGTEYKNHSISYGIGTKTTSYIFIDRLAKKLIETYPNKEEEDSILKIKVIKPLEYKNINIKQVLYDYLKKSNIPFTERGNILNIGKWSGQIPSQRIIDLVSNISQIIGAYYFVKNNILYLVDRFNGGNSGKDIIHIHKITGKFSASWDTTIYNYFYVAHTPDGVSDGMATEIWNCKDQIGNPCLNRYSVKLRYKARDIPRLQKLNVSNSFIDYNTVACSVEYNGSIYYSHDNVGANSPYTTAEGSPSEVWYKKAKPSPCGYWDTIYFTVKRKDNMTLPPYDWIIKATYPIYTEDLSDKEKILSHLKNYKLSVDESISIYGKRSYPISIESSFFTNEEDVKRFMKILAKELSFPRLSLSFTTHYQVLGFSTLLDAINNLFPGDYMYLYGIGKFIIRSLSFDLISGMIRINGIKYEREVSL